MYTYVYFLMSILLIPAFLFLLFLNKNRLNKSFLNKVLFLWLIWTILWPLTEIFYFYDYWMPESVFSIHIYSYYFYMIEDSIFWFFYISTLWLLFYYFLRQKNNISIKSIVLNMTVFVLIFSILFWWFWINSFLTTIFTCVIQSLYLGYKYYDKIKPYIKNVILCSFIILWYMFIVYWILWIMFPGWVDAIYFFKNTPYIIVFWIMPFDDLFWYPFTGILWYIIFLVSSDEK